MKIYVFGRINIDYTIALSSDLIPRTKIVGTKVIKDYGGSGANVATAIARVGKGIRVYLVGAVGMDEDGQLYLKLLERDGVIVSKVKIVDDITGRAFILLEPDGSVTIVSVPGANDRIRIEDIPSDIVESSAVAVTNPPKGVALELLRICRSHNIPVFVDPGKSWLDNLSIIKDMHNTCFYLPNEREFRDVVGMDLETFIRSKEVEDLKIKIVVKRGPRGAVLIDPERMKVIRIGALPLDKLGMVVRSTAGCGDTFTGVFAAIYIEKKNLVEALRYAVVAAGIKATRFYAREIPRRDEVEELLERVESMGLLNVVEESL